MRFMGMIERVKAFLWRDNRRKTLPFMVLMGAVLISVLLFSTKPETKPVQPKERVWSVAAQTARFGVVRHRVHAFGEFKARREIDLRALVSGEVIATSPQFEEGAYVEQGTRLLQIDPFQYENALADAQAQLQGGQAMLSEREAAFKRAELEYERAQRLFERGTVAQKFIDDRLTDVTIARARLSQQKAAVERLQVQVKRAQRNLQNTVVEAPFDAYIGRVNAREGRLLNLNDRVATLTDAKDFEVHFNLSDAEYGRFLATGTALIGSPVMVLWEVGGQSLRLKARLVRVGGRISQNTRGVEAYAQIEDDVPPALRSGAFVTVELEGKEFERAVEIPKNALFGDDKVYVIEDGRLAARQVNIIATTDKTIIIAGGLANGEQILLTRFNEAAAGVAVKAIAP